jgi:indole-3-glycerol phosphate synthase/phosphoribosylanthranilate isomerase/anthranilate synthase/indole-3-glycerol phosphate synthase/phosphoribosylanthranilate isomerase
MFLDRIVAQTRLDLEQRKRERPIEEMQHLAAQQPDPRDLLDAFKRRAKVQLIAEVKRASPSKGLLAPYLDPVKLACLYEAHGAAAISVLTEPNFFLGAPEHLTAIKQAVKVPVLRKDFIIDEYQVYEARAWGADAILLICAILDDTQLRYLLHAAHEQHMRCLVEVHSCAEAQRAVDAGAAIIGVNSRDLVTFEMHPYLIRDIRQVIPPQCVVVAESGIHAQADARRLARYNLQAMLVGESLVVSNDVPAQIHTLLAGANESTQVKICGLRTPEAINATVEAGADMLGLVFYEPSHRYIQPQQVQPLLQASERFAEPSKGQTTPDLVGVFVNKHADFINEVVQQAGLHFVQLHGTESPELCQQICRPIIKALHVRSDTDLALIKAYEQVTWRLLLDTPTPAWGGTGITHDWKLARVAAQEAPIFLSGGLTPDNVASAIHQVHPWGVDVSSGVETNKQKDVSKIRAFVQHVRSALSKEAIDANHE